MTNAVIHGRGRIEVRAELDRDRLLVEVIDEGPGFTPTVREPHPDTAGGNGLRIIEEEACRWGIREGAADVWFELPRHAQGADRATGCHPDTQQPGREPNKVKQTAATHPAGDLTSTLPDHHGPASGRHHAASPTEASVRARARQHGLVPLQPQRPARTSGAGRTLPAGG